MSAQASSSHISNHDHTLFQEGSSSLHVDGSYVLGKWFPFDFWEKIIGHIHTLSDLKQLRQVCIATRRAVDRMYTPHIHHIKSQFCPKMFLLPDSINFNNVLMIHVLPPSTDSLILFLDDSDSGNGLDLAWLSAGRLKKVSLGLDAIPASSVSNVSFSPDGSRIAFLITLAHDTMIQEETDPLHRLRGWHKTTTSNSKLYDISHRPCEDCTVQVIDFQRDDIGLPSELVVHTFSHVFVPEYGFDLVWKKHGVEDEYELAFAALLHASTGAALYLVRWKELLFPSQDNFIFMACIDGASSEFLNDKKQSMISFPTTKCTSRIEIANDAQSVFFDTESKFGILRFDQIADASSCQVLRADLPKHRISVKEEQVPASPNIDRRNSMNEGNQMLHTNVYNSWPGNFRSTTCDTTTNNNIVRRKVMDVTTYVNRMSPDGKLLCSLLGISRNYGGAERIYSQRLEMRLTKTGRILYRKKISPLREGLRKPNGKEMDFEVSSDVAQQVITFSSDSSLLILWDTVFTDTKVTAWGRLPNIIDAWTGFLVQDFRELSLKFVYNHVQASPDALTLYANRETDGLPLMDAVDSLSGQIIKTWPLARTSHSFSEYSITVISNRIAYAMSRGYIDILRETTRGTLGCGWVWTEKMVISEAGSSHDHENNPNPSSYN